MKNKIQQFLKLERNDRVIFFLLIIAIGNGLIAITKFIFSIAIPSLWFGVNAGFGMILSFARYNSIRDYERGRKITNERLRKKIGYKNYLHNGILLILLGISYFFVSVYMYYKGTTTTIHEYLTYLVALIAFWSIGSAIYGMVKYKRDHSPILKAVKITNFANALTSIVLTQVVLLDTYASEYELANVNGYTGMLVSITIMGLGLYMILGIKKYTKNYERIKSF